MSLLFETISIKNKHAEHLDYHQQRLDQTYTELWKSQAFDLKNFLHKIPTYLDPALQYRAKLIYDQNGPLSIAFYPYEKSNIEELQVVNVDDRFAYNFKFLDRSILDQFKQNLAPSTEVIFSRDAKLLESSFSNIAFQKDGLWYTPKTPLHLGTTLHRLLEEKKLHAADIFIEELSKYSHVALFNAMLSWEEAHIIPIEKLMV